MLVRADIKNETREERARLLGPVGGVLARVALGDDDHVRKSVASSKASIALVSSASSGLKASGTAGYAEWVEHVDAMTERRRARAVTATFSPFGSVTRIEPGYVRSVGMTGAHALGRRRSARWSRGGLLPGTAATHRDRDRSRVPPRTEG